MCAIKEELLKFEDESKDLFQIEKKKITITSYHRYIAQHDQDSLPHPTPPPTTSNQRAKMMKATLTTFPA